MPRDENGGQTLTSEVLQLMCVGMLGTLAARSCAGHSPMHALWVLGNLRMHFGSPAGADVEKNIAVAITSDKGLCGGINSTVCKFARVTSDTTGTDGARPA